MDFQLAAHLAQGVAPSWLQAPDRSADMLGQSARAQVGKAAQPGRPGRDRKPLRGARKINPARLRRPVQVLVD